MQIRKRLTYANVMSSLAVFLVLGGATALAAGLGKNTVGTKQLKKNAVTSVKIKNEAVTEGKLANSSVSSAKLAENAVTTGKLENLAVTEGKLADKAITTGKLADKAVTTEKLADNSVTESKIASGAITASKLGTINRKRPLNQFPKNQMGRLPLNVALAKRSSAGAMTDFSKCRLLLPGRMETGGLFLLATTALARLNLPSTLTVSHHNSKQRCRRAERRFGPP